MKLICLLSFGTGDWYNLLTMLPAIMEERNIKKEDLKFFIDCIYFNDDKFKLEKETAIKMMELFTKNWEVVPEEFGSYRNLYYQDESDRKLGPVYEKIKNDFMFYRNVRTRKWIKDRLTSNDIFIYAALGKHIYEWKDGANIFIDYSQKPLDFKFKYDNNISDLIIHVRGKGNNISSNFYNDIINKFLEKNKSIILIGNPNEIQINIKTNVKDLRGIISLEEIMHLIKSCSHMITSCSMFGYHRVLFNKPTIILTPEQTGGGSSFAVFQENVLNNSNYLFLNSDEEIKVQTMERINQWLN